MILSEKKEFPPRWADDELSAFINDALNNQFATFHNKKKEFEILLKIDLCYREIADNLRNPKSILSALLFLRAHSSYRAAVRLALSGQCPETFSLLRNCIENTLYSLHLYKNPNSDEIWLNRHKNKKSLKLVRDEFSYGNVTRTLKNENSKLVKLSRLLYDRCIDFGGHPNEKAVISSLTITEDENEENYQQIYLSGDSIQLDHVLKVSAQIGCLSHNVFRIIFKHKYDILGTTESIDKLTSELNNT